MKDQQHAAPDAAPGPGPGTGPDEPRRDGPAPGGSQEAGGDAAQGGTPPSGALSDALRRDRGQKLIGGVCAGLGRHCDLDPVIFRIGFAVLSVAGGIGLIFYGFAWLFVPFEGEEENEARRLLSGRVDGPALTAVLCALVGCGLFLSVLGRGEVLTFGAVLALLLVGAGYWSRQRGTLDPDPLAAQAAADAPPEPTAPPAPSSFPAWWRGPIVKDGTHDGGTGYLWGPVDIRDASARRIAVTSRWDAGGRPPRAPQVGARRWIGGWVFLLALAAGCLGTNLTWQSAALGTSLQTGLACALAVFGVGIGISAVLGRTGAGSIVLAVLTAVLLAGSSALPKDITTTWMRTTWAPATAAQIVPRYELGSGDGTLDLSRITVAKGTTVSTRAQVSAGHLKVVLPRDTDVRIRVQVGLGDIQLPNEGPHDVDVAPGKEERMTLPAQDGRATGGTLEVRLHVGVGQAEVSRAAA
ncbi:PspC domain-containing protein [Streptomyces sp. TS71-3]|uniref:PspC domain-containing protein n=1 Tax=Streptomyces sp. TS71-3 TaxID=2733862 RepID=UPI001B0905B2|nr:PspC domain-containing protein [Streptomyces sp. TS71-3]GHJ35034.1 membrane protein [Streptomyces sp. TS71-3]